MSTVDGYVWDDEEWMRRIEQAEDGDATASAVMALYGSLMSYDDVPSRGVGWLMGRQYRLARLASLPSAPARMLTGMAAVLVDGAGSKGFDALCLIGCEGVKVQARALMDTARFVHSGAFTMEETDEGVRQLLAVSIADECKNRGDMRMVNAASRSDRAEERSGVMWCGPVDGPSVTCVESFGLRENANS